MSVIEDTRPVEKADDDIRVMSVIDLTGDTKVTWDPSKPIEVESARTTFNTLRGQGYQAHRVAGKKGNKPGERLTEFDPQAQGYIMSPVMVAG